MKGSRTYSKGAKQKKAKKVIFPALTGEVGKRDATLEHNALTDRYDLKVDGSLVLSSFYNLCSGRAKKNGIKWSK